MPHGTDLPRDACLAVCAALVLAASGGCSFLFVKGPPPKHEQVNYFQCTTSKAWPVVDTVFASAYAIETAALIGAASRSDSNETGMKAGAATSAVAAALFAASAMSGYRNASKCREATQALQLRLMRMQPVPGAAPWLPPGSYPPPGAYPYPYQPPPPAVPHDPWLTPPARPFGTPSSSAPPAPPPPAPEPQAPEEEP